MIFFAGCAQQDNAGAAGNTAPAGGLAEKAAVQETEGMITFVELGSKSCIPCQQMQPIMDSIAAKYQGRVRVVFYDVRTSEGRAKAGEYGIRAIPTQVFLDAAGKEYFRHEGFYPEDQVEAALRKGGLQ